TRWFIRAPVALASACATLASLSRGLHSSKGARGWSARAALPKGHSLVLGFSSTAPALNLAHEVHALSLHSRGRPRRSLLLAQAPLAPGSRPRSAAKQRGA